MASLLRKFRSIRFGKIFRSIKESKRIKKSAVFVQKKPLTSFLITLVVLLGIMFAGNTLTSLGKKEIKKKIPVKNVSVFRVSETPLLSLQAKIEKEGVVTITAQMPGIVQHINVKEGDNVKKGESIIQLASSYNGANAASLQHQLAQTQYQNVLDTFQTQKDLILRQREIADKTSDNAQDLRTIAGESRDDTSSLIDLNETIITSLNKNLDSLQNSNAGGVNDSLILQTQQLLAQVRGGNTQLKSSLRQLEFQAAGAAGAADDKPPTQLGNLQKDITLKQLDLQEKALDMNKEVSRIQSQLASVGESLMHPVSPFYGTVERVFVHVGESINPGEQIAVISGNRQSVSAVVSVPSEIAYTVNTFEPSQITINGKEYAITPSYVSKNATEGDLYTVFYSLPDGVTELVTNGDYLPIVIPIGTGNKTNTIPHIPLDSVYQSQSEAYVYIIDGIKAKTKKIQIGTVYGRFVEVISGLQKGDKVITNRNIVVGDSLKVEN